VAVTVAIIKDNKLLILKRKNDPYKGRWDLPGGYMSADEYPEQAIKREMKEELGVDVKVNFIKYFPGSSVWKEKVFSVLGFFYLGDIGNQEIKLNGENSEYEWIPINDLLPENIVYDTNQKFVEWIKENYAFDLEQVKNLISQLDSSAEFREHFLYEAILNGHLAVRYQDDKLVGMGWIFPRRTALRRQAVVEDMIVDESQRGKGLGGDILEELIRWAKDNNIEMIELTSNPKRVAANQLYKKHGFQLHPTNHYLYSIE
jgi:8-oxo-dGTP diphosphatase